MTNSTLGLSVSSSSGISDTNWHHVAFIKVANEYGLYLDGTQDAYATDNDVSTNYGDIWIGAQETEFTGLPFNDFEGYLDEIRIQKSNYFSASPNSGKTDTITIPTGEYGAGGTNNMTLVSNSDTAGAVPSTGRIVLFEEDVDAITLNTDLTAEMSRDGSTWASITLSSEGDYDNNIRILTGLVDFTASGIGSGTSIHWRIKTLNNKDCKIHAVGENWS